MCTTERRLCRAQPTRTFVPLPSGGTRTDALQHTHTHTQSRTHTRTQTPTQQLSHVCTHAHTQSAFVYSTSGGRPSGATKCHDIQFCL